MSWFTFSSLISLNTKAKAEKLTTLIWQVWKLRPTKEQCHVLNWHSVQDKTASKTDCRSGLRVSHTYVLLKTLFTGAALVRKDLLVIFEGTVYYRELHLCKYRLWLWFCFWNTRNMLVSGISRTEKQSLTNSVLLKKKKKNKNHPVLWNFLATVPFLNKQSLVRMDPLKSITIMLNLNRPDENTWTSKTALPPVDFQLHLTQ